ncbi:HPP family-domain-containing protein [Boeremia exigua]|uniref:HPP family-domain-containing protein n=1 Tax=Boeremia exigua TaxID=749465 RepID=UPI001E8E4AC7|nr:HPP family-domain-containing protein [Boeremia exigua]KAH6643138.1 HPP family-domain-containing protein [Boeremia exigua]
MPLWDPFVPAERVIQRGLAHLPTWISHWLGYRGSPVPPSRNWVICLWGFIGAWGGVASILAVFGHLQYFHNIHLVPPIVASFGASAILCYGAIDVPLAQPRSLIFGHFFSGLVGVIMATIFQFNLQEDPYPRLQWLAASLATAFALVVMHLTKTTHPPAGATALIPCVDPHIWALRWYYLPVLLLSSMIVLVSACLVNNLQRQYPKFWVAQIPPPPAPAPAPKPAVEDKATERSSDGDTLGDLERGSS